MSAAPRLCRIAWMLPLLPASLVARPAHPALERSQLVVMLPGAVSATAHPLVLRISQWTTRKPYAELLPYDHERVQLTASSVRIAHQTLEAHLAFQVSDRQVNGAGEMDVTVTLNGNRGAGGFHGQFGGAAVHGSAQAAVAFDHSLPVGVASLRLWLPDLTREVRGVLLWGNGAGGDSRVIVLDERLQAFAAANRLAIVGTCLFGAAMRHGDGQQLLDGLRAFADITGHRELANAPLLFSGHSNGGQMAYEFNAWMPSRVIAFSVWRGGFYESYQGLSAESLATPAVFSAGEKDAPYRVAAIRKLFEGNRPLGANWSLLVEENKSHERGNSLTLFLVAFQSALDQRLPRNASALKGPVTLRPVDARRAWLADNTTWSSGITTIEETRRFSGDARPLSWLLDADNAFIYRGLASYANPLVLARARHSPTYRAAEPVVLECTSFGSGEWKSVAVYDGARKLGLITPDRPRFTIRGPHRPGAHASVLLGERGDGSVRTSIPVEWIVWPAN